MKRLVLLAAAAASIASAVPIAAHAQGVPQTVVAVDVRNLATGYRASKIIGSAVVNSANKSVGTVDDLIISRDQHQLFAILSVGGFLGLDKRLIAVPYTQLVPSADSKQFVLANATPDSVKAMPEYQYAK